ncbi:RCC1 domain-containing protein 1 [Frankliniella fusca]|uniref:RCC1 domain-containing protein 1 n=1 Tax=Frankliniella fusca TaxID=407009 RepID=A0AAE1H393_9NEOP|nr:RCC1 domain-containing protein 1 [Frankliniella fusca]
MTLYYCGWNGCGQASQSSGSSIIIRQPIKLNFDEPVIGVSCSWSTLAVVAGKSVIIMGFIENCLNVRKEISLGSDCQPLQLSSCLGRTLITCSKGNCYDYNTESNKLRELVKFTISEPELEESPSNENSTITKVCCSDFGSLALSKSGKVFTIPSPLALQSIVVTDIACGNNHYVLLTENGSVFTWGDGSRGQLGHGNLESEEKPRLVEALSGIQVLRISAGAWHNAVVSSSGDLYTWGWGTDGQLGIDEEVEEEDDGNTPIAVKKLKMDEEVSLLQKRNEKYRGIVLACPSPVDTFTDVNTVSCGSRHTIVLLVDGTVWGCGWNAYGQLACPPEDCFRSIRFRQISIPNFQGKILSVQCGGWSSCFIV